MLEAERIDWNDSFFKLEPISYFITIISYCVRVGKHNIFRYNLPKQANISIQ